MLFVGLLCTACQPNGVIKYTIEESDEGMIGKYNSLWSAEEFRWIQDNKNNYLIFACAKDYIPIEYLEGNSANGIGVNVLKEVSKVTGLKFRLYENNLHEEWLEIINSFKEKKIDILPTVSYSDDRIHFMDFTEPYIQTRLAIIGHEDNNQHRLTLDHIKNHTIAIPRGYWLNEYLTKVTNGNIRIYMVDNTQEAFEAVNSKKADFIISEIPTFTYYRESETYTHIRIVGEIAEKNPIMAGIQKNLPMLKSIINKVINNSDKSLFFETTLIVPSRNNGEELLIMIMLLSIIVLVIGYFLSNSLHKLITTKKLLEINIKQKEKFMADISHDLKTPIMIIIGYIDTIVYGEVKDTSHIQKYLKKAQSAASYIQSLINDLFMLSKLENNQIKLQKEEALINELIEDIVSIIKIKADKKNVQIIVDLTSTVNTFIQVDSFRIRQVLANILFNAIKHTSEGGEIFISTKCLNNGITQILIRDNGIGISPEDLPYVFDRYYKSENNADTQATGLGLCIAKQLIDLHGGRIWVESLPGKGSTFYIKI